MSKLRVRSYFSDSARSVGQLDSAIGSQVFVRENRSLIGFGELVRLSASGPNRIAELNRQWRELLASAVIDDQVALPGSGAVAFASISFAAESAFESVLIVPQRIEVITPERSWVTEIELLDNPAAESLEPSGSAEAAPAAVASTAAASSTATQDPPTAPFRRIEFQAGRQDEEQFIAAVTEVRGRIRSGSLSKVVLARDIVQPVGPNFDALRVVQRLHRRYPQCWTYSFNDNFGASPELLVRSARGEVSARVLAGTAARGTDPDVDRAIAEGLTHSTKNLHEHEFALESLVATLEPFCDRISADAKPFALALPDLWHLASDVTGHLKTSATLLDLVDKLHPTAAVAGTPRGSAQKLIAELEPFDRGGYTGPVGWISGDGSGELAIALRGGRFERESGAVRAFAGCGIVSESDADAELAETELKFRAIRWAFAGDAANEARS